MALPFELTVLPPHALDILRFLGERDNYAAFDGEIVEALALSDRGFGKAIRRLVTKEYVEMQYDGSYVLSRIGVEAAEAIAAHDEEALAETDLEADDLDTMLDDEDEGEAEPIEPVTRNVIVVYPRHFKVGRPGYVFLRVDVPALEGPALQQPAELMVELHADVAVDPARHEMRVPLDEAGQSVRFMLTPTAAGRFDARVEVYQVSGLDTLEAGQFELDLMAGDGPAQSAFRVETFQLTLLPEG